MPYTNLLIDLDGTVYPNDNGIWDAIASRMDQFMQEEMGLSEDEIPSLREDYYTQFGTTLSGLRRYHNIDESKYLRYVHDIPLHQYLHPDLELRELLLNLPQKKWIFTNSDQKHSERVLRALDIYDLFDGILDINKFKFVNKPNPLVYKYALELIGNPPPTDCIFLDDSWRNLVPAKKLGITTVLVSKNSPKSVADFTISTIHQLATIPGLLEY